MVEDQTVVIRLAKKADYPTIVAAHEAIYQDEYGFDQTFVSFVERSLHEANEDDYIWLATDEHEDFLGSIAVYRVDEQNAQLRFFLVRPSGRGKGLGRALMDIACDHAKAARYVSLMLWTNAQLVAARALYDAYNFKMMETKRSFLSQQWVKEEKWVCCLKDI